MKKELFTKLLLALFVVLACVSLTACGDDDDEPGQVTYTYGWEGAMTGGSLMTTDMGIIEDAYTTALGVKDSPFTLNGTKSECDAKIKTACDKVEQTLKDEVWDFNADFVIREQSSNKIVYSCSFKQGSNLF